MEYNLYPTERDILHFGKGHDDNPPGRGSGRFAFGSGKRPNQHVGPKKQPKTKEEILRSASAREVLAIQSELTNDELRNAKDRIEINQRLREYSAKEVKTKWDKVNDMMKKARDVVNWTDTGIKAWNQFAAIYNSTSNSKEKLPRINMGGGDNNSNKNNNKK